MTFYQIFHLILHEIDRFGCFMLKSGFFFQKAWYFASGELLPMYRYCVEYCSTKTAKNLDPFEVLTILGLNLLLIPICM